MRLLAALIFVTTLSGCGPKMVNCRADSDVPGMVRVTFTKLDDDIFQFVVVNYSHSVLMVYRDRVMLLPPDGVPRARIPGGVSSVYSIAPGQVHKVNVKYDLSGIKSGDQFAVSFAQAIDLGPGWYGPPDGRIAVAPIPFIAQ